MMSSRRVFTIEEIDSLIPRLSQLVGEQLTEQSEIERRLAELASLLGEMPRSLDVVMGDSADVKRLKRELARRIEEYENGWRKVSELGAVVKDPQIGLVDFYGRIDGRLVCFCWRYGEESLGYYHELESGYAGRRPLGLQARGKLLN